MLPHVGSSCHLFLGITLQPWPDPWPKIVAKSIQLASNYIIVLVKLYKDLIDGETMSVSLKKALKIATLGLPPFLVSDAVPKKRSLAPREASPAQLRRMQLLPVRSTLNGLVITCVYRYYLRIPSKKQI
jgi:hypothetical protein